jgi:hypothetical protein
MNLSARSLLWRKVDEIAVTFEHSTLKCLTSYSRYLGSKILSETIYDYHTENNATMWQ